MTTLNGEFIRNRRIEREISQSQLAKLVGFHPSHMHYIETGVRGRHIQYDKLVKLAEVLGVEVSDLFVSAN